MNRSYFVWAVVAVVVVGGGWYGYTHRTKDELHVQTAPVTSGPVVRRIVVAGTLQALKSVDVGCQVSGVIKTLNVDFNSLVKKGQVLAQIDPAPFQDALDVQQAAYEQSQSDLQGYEVELEDTTQKLTRAKELAGKDLLAKSDFDAAQIAVDSAKADVESGHAGVTRAKANVDQAKTNLDHTIITAPTDGIIVNRAVEVGQTVASSFTAPVLYTIAANLEEMQVQALVDEADIGAVKEGSEVSFDVESYPDQTFHGVIDQLRLQPTAASGAGGGSNNSGANSASAAATTGVTYTAIIDVANPDHRLRPGMTATAVLLSSAKGDVTRIPNQALLFRPSLDLLKAVGQSGVQPRASSGSGDEDLDQVWTYDGTHFTPSAIRIGLSDAQWVEVVSGSLKPGDTVVVNATYGPPVKAPTGPAPTGSPFGQPGGRGR